MQLNNPLPYCTHDVFFRENISTGLNIATKLYTIQPLGIGFYGKREVDS